MEIVVRAVTPSCLVPQAGPAPSLFGALRLCPLVLAALALLPRPVWAREEPTLERVVAAVRDAVPVAGQPPLAVEEEVASVREQAARILGTRERPSKGDQALVDLTATLLWLTGEVPRRLVTEPSGELVLHQAPSKKREVGLTNRLVLTAEGPVLDVPAPVVSLRQQKIERAQKARPTVDTSFGFQLLAAMAEQERQPVDTSKMTFGQRRELQEKQKQGSRDGTAAERSVRGRERRPGKRKSTDRSRFRAAARQAELDRKARNRPSEAPVSTPDYEQGGRFPICAAATNDARHWPLTSLPAIFQLRVALTGGRLNSQNGKAASVLCTAINGELLRRARRVTGRR